MTEFLAILAAGVGTYLSRAALILTLATRRLPRPAEAALEFVAPAVLGALIATLLVDAQGRVTIGIPEAAGLLAGGVAAWRSRNHVWTLLTGMIVYWLLRGLV